MEFPVYYVFCCFLRAHTTSQQQVFYRKPNQEKDLGENPKTHLHLTQNSFSLCALCAPTFAVPKYSMERPSRTNVPFNTNLMWKYKMAMHRKPSLEKNFKQILQATACPEFKSLSHSFFCQRFENLLFLMKDSRKRIVPDFQRGEKALDPPCSIENKIVGKKTSKVGLKYSSCF